MATIRNMDSGAIVDVEDDGRRLSFSVETLADDEDFECCISDSSLCDGHHRTGASTRSGGVTFDKAELLALLGVAK